MSFETRAGQPIGRQRLESWLQSHIDIVAVAIVALGFLLRLRSGPGTYLNPDEATNYLIAHQTGLGAVYHASLTSPHPPLYYFLLYFWRMLGDSEFMLRLPSMLAGTAFLWFGYRWIGELFGKPAGFAALLILAFSPLLISMSAEVRSYSFLLLLLVAVLWTMQRMFDQPSVGRMALFSLLLYLAILTHYSILGVTLALGIYVVIRALRRELPAPVTKAWVLVQAVAAGLWILLYVTHLAHLKGSGIERSAADIWLRASYFHRGEDNLLLFPVRATGMLFRYLFDSRLLGIPEVLFALAGVVLLITRPPSPGKRLSGLLLLLPFLVAAGLALVGVLPYGGSRQDIFLMPFAVAGVAVFLAWLSRQRLLPILVGAIVLMPAWSIIAPKPDYRIRDQRKQVIESAMSYARQTVPPGSTVFCDFQASQLLGYYLDRQAITEFPLSVTELGFGTQFLEYRYSGYRVVTEVRSWSFTPDDFAAELSRFRNRQNDAHGAAVWVIDAGWGPTLCTEQDRSFPDFSCLDVKTFGDNLAVFRVQERTPEMNAAALTELAAKVVALPGPPVNAVLLPSDARGDSAFRLLREHVRQTLSYADFYRSIQDGQHRLEDFLPALAFWIFNTGEEHVQGFSFMNGRESYAAGGYEFEFLALSSDSSAAVYRITRSR
jgi:hypothetical protein